MNSPVLDFDPGSSDKVAHSPRNKNFAGRSLSGDSGTGVDCDTSNLAADDFAFPVCNPARISKPSA